MVTKSPTTKESLHESALQSFKRRFWKKILAWEMYDELRREVVYGEVRIVFHEGKMRDLYVEIHGHHKDNDLTAD